MAATINTDSTIPESTGAVQTPTDPVEIEATPGHPESTGAVKTPGPVTTEFGDLGTESTNTVETPGPVTTLAPQVKVVRSGRRAAAESGSTAETGNASAPTFDGR